MKTSEEFLELWPDWEPEEEIGRGAESVVYRAHLKSDPLVKSAFKRIVIPGDESEILELLMQGYTQEQVQEYIQQMVEEKINEIRILQKLKDTGAVVEMKEYSILPVQDSARTVIYIRMELLESLESYLRDREVKEQDILTEVSTFCGNHREE